ncbi:MAG: prepilin-type N-terminal cleavage/methylation domain-containing protein, partial [Gammaproteobacteria bacterium]|nr:prepilin-type N-terminal cleavage/methylation domain-containing protein [Gammaproteobacteria bacterium]
RYQRGFSLVELIVVVVLLGLLAGGAGLLIVRPIEAYQDQVRRQQLVDQAEMALRQIARDVRQALPNSIRIAVVGSGFAVEMVNTVDGARYRDEFGGDFIIDDSFTLEFSAGDTDFNLLGGFNVLTPPLTLGARQRLVIYNTSWVDIYTDAALNNNPGIITPTGTAIDLSVITPPMDGDEFHINMVPAFQFAQRSPGQRIFVVDGPISYICNPASGRILRHVGYNYSVAQPTPPAGGSSDVVVSQLSGCSLTYNPGSAQRGGILTIEITIADSGESVSLLHQVHVVNVP